MEKKTLNWKVGYSSCEREQPKELYPAVVPGSVQMDYARHAGWDPFYKGVNYKDYGWMEDVYWHYSAPLDFALEPGQTAAVLFKGIDYRYRISADEEVLTEGEGMFSHVRCDVTKHAGKTLRVLIWPAPKCDDSGTRDQQRYSCKSAACYGWDWHPRLISAGLWDDVKLLIQNCGIENVDASYRLDDNLDCCRIDVRAEVCEDCTVAVQLLDGETVVAEQTGSSENQALQTTLTLQNPKLWNPVGYGAQNLYTLRTQTRAADGTVLDEYTRSIGFRRSRMVMNEGSWIEPQNFPKSRSDAPATLEINGRRIFAKGSNWVNAQVLPGDMNEENYQALLDLVLDANMNILRIWGGGFVNKESFFDYCDQKGIMIWQEFPLACNEYPDDDGYLKVLEKEATAIIRRLRTHPCVVLWCGGNELFNNWSKMTEQHHALRLLDKLCYEEDRFTPFMMTSPLNGMGHGHYLNYDETIGRETITTVVHSNNTAYTEFGAPGAADAEFILDFMSQEDFEDCNSANEVWVAHHGFKAWWEDTWLRKAEAQYFYGGYTDLRDLLKKMQDIQVMCYRSYFEEMRRQWPQCSMALNWCFNEPWPTVANNSLVAWPVTPRRAHSAVREALRAQMSSLRIERQLWWGGEEFHGEIWLLNDAITDLEQVKITAFYQIGDGPEVEWGTLNAATLAPQSHRHIGDLSFRLPDGYQGNFRISLKVSGRPDMDSVYTYPCRCKEQENTEGILNM